VEVLKISSTPLGGEALLRAISAAMKHPRFALAISHDSFQAFTGGIQTLINDERKALDLGGASQIHACPVERINRHSTDDRVDLIVSVDGKPLCVADSREFVNALTALAPDASCVSVQVHHTMNWSIGALDELLSKFPDAPKFFWIHDYYTVCEGYNLLRNDRAFCNAPPVDSNSCSICKYGVRRPEHLAAMKAFLDRWRFEFLAPSERAAEVWLKGYPEHKDRVKVTPIYDLVPTETRNANTDPAGRKIRVAFPGISYEFKGWSEWRQLVDALQNNSDYELIHLGQKTEALQHTTFPERFRRVRSGPENAHALPDALQEEQIDIVFYCPIWPETFSLIAYEAHGVGCWTLTTQDSGNVAVYVESQGSGKVFVNADSLIDYLIDAEQVREDLSKFRSSTPYLSKMAYKGEIVDDLYLGCQPRAALKGAAETSSAS
jgi:hypothetical protein